MSELLVSVYLSTNLTVNPAFHLFQSLHIYMSGYASKEQYLVKCWPWYLLSLLKCIFCSSVPKEKCKPSTTAVVIKILHIKIMCCHNYQLYQIIKSTLLFKCWLTKLELTCLIFLSSLFQSIQLHSLVMWLPLNTYCRQWNCPWYVTQM